MKRKWIGACLGLAVCAAAGLSAGPAQAEEASTETQAPETLEADPEEEEKKEDVSFEADGTAVFLKNDTGLRVDSVEVKASEEKTEEEKENISLVFHIGETVHIFEEVSPKDWADPILTEENGFLYIRYTDTEGKEKELHETAEMIVPEEELAMWALTDVYVRQEAASDSEAIAVAGVGDECKVTGFCPGWYQVEYEGTAGYISHRYLTGDKDEADAAVRGEEQAAAAAAAQNVSNSYHFSTPASGTGNAGSSVQEEPGASQEAPQEEPGASQEETEDPQQCLQNGLLN